MSLIGITQLELLNTLPACLFTPTISEICCNKPLVPEPSLSCVSMIRSNSYQLTIGNQQCKQTLNQKKKWHDKTYIITSLNSLLFIIISTLFLRSISRTSASMSAGRIRALSSSSSNPLLSTTPLVCGGNSSAVLVSVIVSEV